MKTTHTIYPKYGCHIFEIEAESKAEFYQELLRIYNEDDDCGKTIDGLFYFFNNFTLNEKQLACAYVLCSEAFYHYKDIEYWSEDNISRNEGLKMSLDYFNKALALDPSIEYIEELTELKFNIGFALVLESNSDDFSNEFSEDDPGTDVSEDNEYGNDEIDDFWENERRRQAEMEAERIQYWAEKEKREQHNKGRFKRFIRDVFVADVISNSVEKRNHTDYQCHASSGWRGYEDFIGGPIQIDNKAYNDCSAIRCYRPGMVYSGADHTECTPHGKRAIHAYWSGEILYADLSDGRTCEWYSPGCPTIK